MRISLLLFTLFSTVHSIDVIPNPSHSYGAWNGWGTSLCWFAAAFGDRQDVAQVLYTRQNVMFLGNTVPGLGFNIARYNAGAESSDKVNGSSMVLSPNMIVGREIEGFWVTPDQWDWSRDALQTTFIKTIYKIAETPSQLDFELFSNSPMWWQLYNHNPSGAKNAKDDNLNPAYYQQHAEYLTTIAKYFRDTHNITFKTVEAFNEPTSTWWHATNNQEGCHFGASSQSTFLPMLQSSLNNAGLNDVKIVASDECYFSQAIDTWNDMTSDTRNIFTRINVHGYQSDGDPQQDRDTLYQLVSKTHAIRMNEHGDGDDSGATLVQAVLDDINILHADSWVYWQALDGGGWGIISADINSKSISGVNTKYYAVAQFSRHIRVNDVVVENSDMEHTVTAYRPNSNNIKTSLVIFVTYNPSSSSLNYTYSIQSFTSSTFPSLVITSWITTTTGTSHYVPLGTSYVNGTSCSLQIPAYGVMTTEIEILSNMDDDIAIE